MLWHAQQQAEDHPTCLVIQRLEHACIHWDGLVAVVEVREEGGTVLAAAAQKHRVGVVQVLQCQHVGVWVNGWSVVTRMCRGDAGRWPSSMLRSSALSSII